MANQLEHIAEYYDKTLPFYKTFWHRDKSYALHYGFWDKTTKSLSEALLNENRFLAGLTEIKPKETILDAGCGVGGSAIWLAKNFDVKVWGITISRRQLEEAKRLAAMYRLKDKVEFDYQDYLHTKFPDNYFDIVWAIESVCHADNKKEFLKEAHRILKPKGRLIVADGFLKRSVRKSEEVAYKEFLEGFALPNIVKMSDFRSWMHEVGFNNIKFLDKTKAVDPSSRIMFRRVSLAYPIVKILHKFNLLPIVLFKNSRAGIAQRKLVKQGAAGYAAFYGEKKPLD